MNTPGRIVFCVALLATSTSARAQSEMTTTKSAIQAEDVPGEVTVIEQVVEIELEERVETVA